MRNLVVIFAIVFTCLAASCTQRTCPTYTKEMKDIPQEEQVNVENDKSV
ncbi:MAG: hypothetical protein MI975_19820 [Cytophagales bacterium]|nr:hypothetical protein [Cytophagales bacterium]